jgi:hypothetical protein
MLDAIKRVHPMPIKKNQLITGIIVFIILAATGLYASGVNRSQPGTPEPITISQGALEEQYGLRVLLLAVTGAGGFVDLRINIVDGEKAKTLLSDPANFPAVWVSNEVILNAPADTKSQKIQFDDGGTMFIMYPNSQNAVMQGTPVRIVFGDIALEPINAR